MEERRGRGALYIVHYMPISAELYTPAIYNEGDRAV